MDYKHYYKTDNMIGIGNVVFRHYSATPPETEGKNRFVQFVENTLTELTPEDFGDITVVPDYCLLYGLDHKTSLEKITFPDSVTTFGTSDVNMCNVQIEKDLTFVFPKNVSKFNNSFGNLITAGSEGVATVVYDFSKATKVPDIAGISSGSFAKAKEIRVPISLYDAWISGWSEWIDGNEEKAGKITAV